MRKKSTWNPGEGKILKTYNTWTNSKRILLGDSPHEHDVVIKTFQNILIYDCSPLWQF